MVLLLGHQAKLSSISNRAQQGRAYATHAAVFEQLRGMPKAAKYGCGWVVEGTATNPTAPEEMREWRADLAGFDSKGRPVRIDVTIRSHSAPLVPRLKAFPVP